MSVSIQSLSNLTTTHRLTNESTWLSINIGFGRVHQWVGNGPITYSFFLAGSFQFSFRSALPSAYFVYRLPCYPRLSIFNCVSNLIDLILDVFCSFRYMLANSFCTFSSFRELVLVGFFLLHLEAVFTSARFSLTSNVSHMTLSLVLCLIGMHSAAASKWALTKFLYSSFRVCVSVFSCSALNLFLSVNAYLFLISLLLSRDQ